VSASTEQSLSESGAVSLWYSILHNPQSLFRSSSLQGHVHSVHGNALRIDMMLCPIFILGVGNRALGSDLKDGIIMRCHIGPCRSANILECDLDCTTTLDRGSGPLGMGDRF